MSVDNSEPRKTLQKIGEGTYARVYRILNDENTRAVKIPRLGKYKNLQNEIDILKNLDHTNIVKFDSADNKVGEFHFYNEQIMFMEFLDGMSMDVRIMKSESIPKSEFLSLSNDISNALIYLKSLRIIHRDIKSANIVKSSSGYKLIDFGFALSLTNDQLTYKSIQIDGTPFYMAPESIHDGLYSHASDLWAFGVVLYEVLTLRQPFDAPSLSVLKVRISSLVYERFKEDHIQEIFDEIFVRSYMERIDIESLKTLINERF